MQLSEQTFDSTNLILPYLYSQPGADADAPEGGWPLIFFLHGAGERGRDLALIRAYGIPAAVERVKNFPFVTVSPLCPPYTYWEDLDEVLFALLDEITTRCPVDARRVYLTGLSMGGHGTWILGLQQPRRFAALAPVCAPYPNLPDVLQRLPVLKAMPVWVFHGAKDDEVPVRHSETMVAALRGIHNPVRFTVYPHARHDSWVRAYRDPALYAWFLEHRRNGRGAVQS
jgi:predicted peptidase